MLCNLGAMPCYTLHLTTQSDTAASTIPTTGFPNEGNDDFWSDDSKWYVAYTAQLLEQRDEQVALDQRDVLGGRVTTSFYNVYLS